MLSTTFFSALVAFTGLVATSVAHPTDKHKLATEKHHANHTDSLLPFNSTVPPIVQIHPANRTDLCLGVISPINPGPVANSTLGLVSCNVVQPNNETRFYGWWDPVTPTGYGQFGYEILRLVNTQLCLEDSLPPSNAKVQTCVADFPAQSFSYVEDTQQINVANSTWCLGIGQYNFPEIQQCVPGDKAQAWVMK